MDFYRQAASVILGQAKSGIFSIGHAETAMYIDERGGFQGAIRSLQPPSELLEHFL